MPLNWCRHWQAEILLENGWNMLEWLVGFCECSGTHEATLEYPEVFHFLIFLGQLASLDIF